MPRRSNFKLYAARVEKLWTVKEAAAAVGVSPQTILRWEARKQDPHVSSLRSLCTAYNEKPWELGY